MPGLRGGGPRCAQPEMIVGRGLSLENGVDSPQNLEYFADAQGSPGALVFNSIAWHGIFGKCLKSLLERQLAFLPPACTLVGKRPLFPPNVTPLYPEKTPPSSGRSEVVLTQPQGRKRGLLGSWGKVVRGRMGCPGLQGSLARPFMGHSGIISFVWEDRSPWLAS